MRIVIVAADAGAASQLASTVTAPVDLHIVVPDDVEVDVAGPALAAALTPHDVLVVGSDQRSRDLAGWVSASLDLPLAWAAEHVDVADDRVTINRPILGGTHRMTQQVDGGAVVSVKVAGGDHTGALPQTLLDLSATSQVRITGDVADQQAGASLTCAKVIVSVGRGIGGPDNVARYRELADLAGAALGASRVVVDSGWLSFAHQVGQTGTSVAPDLYVAFGISGAIQHLAGMRASKRVIAINTDPEAPICRVADVVVQADANDVADALLKKFADDGRTA
jgi:electron transfer flavoprotein alpha subunit